MFEHQTERRGFPGGLRAQLLLGLLVLVVGTMALVALVGGYLTRRQVEQSALQRTLSDARVLAELHGSAVDRRLLEAFCDHADLAYARVVGPDGTIELGTLPEGADDAGTPRNAQETEAETSVRTRNLAGAPYAVATVDPASGDRRAVAVRSLEPARARVDRARRMLLAYLGIDALFILIVGYAFFTYVVVRPIRAIGVATERAARGDLASHIEILPPNEFGRVGHSFNRMLDELRENREQLEARLEELDAAYTELEETQESLIRSEKMASVGQLAAGVAHEVGNPLSAISGYLDCFEEMDLDEERRADLVARMQNQVDRIQSIIRDLLDFSRDDNEQPLEAVGLAACIDEAGDLLAPQPRSREIELSVDLPEDLPEVHANRDQVVQVLVNLFMNAADAIKRDADSGEIRVSADSTDGVVELRVADDGPGIPDEARDQLFDPFYTTKDPGEGTGLGLAIAHRIMERFDGAIEIEESSETGTTFLLRFRPDEEVES